MKNSLYAGLFLLFTTVVALLLLTGGYALYMAGGLSETGLKINSGLFFRILISSLPLLLPLALTAGFFMVFLRLRYKPGIRLLTSVILFIAAFGLLWSSSILAGTEIPEKQTLNSEKKGEYPPQTFTELQNGSVFYRNKMENSSIRGLMIAYEENRVSSFELVKGELPELPERDRKTELPSLALDLFQEGTFHDSSLFSDFSLTGAYFLSWKNSGNNLNFLLAIGAFALYLTSCWGIIQISRWPLFNALTSLLLLSAGGIFYRLFSAHIFREILALLEDRIGGIPLVVIAMTGAAVLLFLVDLLFIPYKKRVEL